jgi:stage V sporulation protein S
VNQQEHEMANDTTDDKVLRVANTSSPADLASAISHALYDGQKVTLRAIGAASVNQAVKGIAIARSYVAARGLDLVCAPGFTEVPMPDSEKPMTAILFRVRTL